MPWLLTEKLTTEDKEEIQQEYKPGKAASLGKSRNQIKDLGIILYTQQMSCKFMQLLDKH